MRKLKNHSNIISLEAVFETENSIYVILERKYHGIVEPPPLHAFVDPKESFGHISNFVMHVLATIQTVTAFLHI